MAGRWGDRAAFRAASSADLALRPTGRQSVALLAVLVLVAGAVAAASYFVRPDKSRSFDVFGGSLFLEDSLAPVAVDLATGRPTVRLVDANMQVGAKKVDNLGVTPLQNGTLLLNRDTGEFNIVDSTGFLIKRDGGVPLPSLRGATSATAVASGELSYIEQHSATRTSVYLVSRSTVQTAVASAKVRPRAFRAMTSPISTAPEASASADGNLWTLAGLGNERTIRRLSVPPNSKPGATLATTDYGTVSGAAAIGTATDGHGSIVGVATDDQIRLFRRGTLVATARFTPQAGVSSILPATDAQGRLAFLMRSSNGWSLVSVATDGSDLRGPTALNGVAASADLVQPVWSNGALYTMDADGGQFVRIDGTGAAGAIPGAGRYPLAQQNGKVIEPGGFSDAYAVGRGSRVIFNSPAHRDALVVFTDGSHPPLRIAKSAAVTLNAAGDADALTRSRLGNPTGKGARKGQAKPKPRTDPISNKIDCKAATQKPHIPTIVQATPGSRSVLLAWSYPLLDPQDCEPSTYQLQIATLTSGAPSAPSSLTVQGQKSVNLSGLNPSTKYQITVTAYINGLGTPSSPIQVTTGPSGPDEPLGVQASVNSSGAWTVDWSSCGSSGNGCVPAASWRVIPQFCDGLGVSTAPSPIDVTADPTTTVQPAARLDGGSALLGRGIRFQVEGIGADGSVGTPSSSTSCVYSWSNPIPGDISVSASTPASTNAASTTSTDAVVRYASAASLGGVGAQLSYRLIDSSGSTISSVGPTSNTAVQLGGIRPGVQYRVAVTVIPPRHPEAAVTLATVAVTPTIATWPDFGVYINYDPVGLTDATLTTSFRFPLGTDTRGETFDLVNSGMDCGNTHYSLQRQNVSPGQAISFKFSRVIYYGSCTVTLQLTQNAGTATSPPLFGSTSSSAFRSDPFQVTLPEAYTTGDDFDAQWTGSPENPRVSVSYHGADDLTLSSASSITVSNGSSDCGSVGGSPPATIDVDLDCARQGGTFTVSVDYTYLGDEHQFDNIQVQGTAPQPVDPGQISFSAYWIGSAGSPAVDLHYSGSEDPTSFGALNWTETVVSNGVACGSSTAAPGSVDLQIPVDLSACPPTDATGAAAGYTVVVHLSDPTDGSTGDYVPDVSGTPPQ